MSPDDKPAAPASDAALSVEIAAMPDEELGPVSDTNSIFMLERPQAPWGDYGSILYNGLIERGGIKRTGPFIPPISFPGIGNIVVTDAMKNAMERAGFRGIKFQEMQKALIVESDWHTWDRTSPNLPRRPPGGEPEGYVEGEHSKSASDQMGRIWRVVLTPGAVLERIQTGPKKFVDIEDRYVSGTWNGADLFAVTRNARPYLSARAADWFTKHFKEWVEIRPVAKAEPRGEQ